MNAENGKMPLRNYYHDHKRNCSLSPVLEKYLTKQVLHLNSAISKETDPYVLLTRRNIMSREVLTLVPKLKSRILTKTATKIPENRDQYSVIPTSSVFNNTMVMSIP